jgi:hypothetical protein
MKICHAKASEKRPSKLIVVLIVRTTTLAARGGLEEERVNYYPDFFENHQFYGIYCVTLAFVLFFEEFLIHDSHCAIFRSLPAAVVKKLGYKDNSVNIGGTTPAMSQNGSKCYFRSVPMLG